MAALRPRNRPAFHHRHSSPFSGLAERRRAVAKEFGRVSKQRELITLKKLVSSGRIVSAGCLNKGGVGFSHYGYSV